MRKLSDFFVEELQKKTFFLETGWVIRLLMMAKSQSLCLNGEVKHVYTANNIKSWSRALICPIPSFFDFYIHSVRSNLQNDDDTIHAYVGREWVTWVSNIVAWKSTTTSRLVGFLLDDDKPLLENWWFLNQPIEIGGWTSRVYNIHIYLHV